MNYVLNVILNENRDSALLIKKNRPKWQKGKYNFIGGKIENTENEFEAVIRETREECGLYIYPELIGTMKGDDFLVYVYRSIINNLHEASQKTDEEIVIIDEKDWHNIKSRSVDTVPEILAICSKEKPQKFIFNH